jgi:hypothetical protein
LARRPSFGFFRDMSKRDLDQLASELLADDNLPSDLKAIALRGAARAVLEDLQSNFQLAGVKRHAIGF